MYRKFIYYNQESYRLDHIANVELGERKLDYSEQGTLHLLYKNDYQKFIEYNIKDVELVERLEGKLKLLEMIVSLAYLCKVNYRNTFGQVRMWDTLIYNHLLSKNIIIQFNLTDVDICLMICSDCAGLCCLFKLV